MKKISKTIIAAFCLPLLISSCASKKSAMTEKATVSQQPSATPRQSPVSTPEPETNIGFASYMKKVLDNRVYAQNVVSDMTFNIKMDGKDLTVPGSIHMRRDEVIRLQLFIPLLGTEVGRIEFSPDRVLIIDRMHKEYLEGDYTQLDFLEKNGLNFYSIQALFWNQLLMPGAKDVSEKDIPRVELVSSPQSSASQSIKLSNGKMTYNWTTQPATGQIVMTNIGYASANSGASSLLWMYSDFRTLGTKLFPAHQEFQFSTTATKQARNVKITLQMTQIKDKGDWEAKTVVSSKYKKIEASELLGKLLSR